MNDCKIIGVVSFTGYFCNEELFNEGLYEGRFNEGLFCLSNIPMGYFPPPQKKNYTT